MNSQWQIDLYNGLNNATDMQDVLDTALKAIKPLGFDHVGWRAKLPLPMSKHRFSLLNDNEDRIYKQRIEGAYDSAPVPKHCSQSTDPILWTGTTEDPTFLKAPDLISEYYSSGHYGGWAQSMIESKNIFSMLYADTNAPIEKRELENVSLKMEWITISVLIKMNQVRHLSNVELSLREKEILSWTGDGKTADEIAQILNLSHSTINFHLRKSMYKLNAPNKTSAVVKAIYLNLLH